MTFIYPYPYYYGYPSYLYYPDYNPFLRYPYSAYSYGSYPYSYSYSYSYGTPYSSISPSGDETQPSYTEGTSLSSFEWLQRQLRVEPQEGNQYLVEWIGSTEGVRQVEFQAVDAAGKVLSSRQVTTRPFRGSLQVPSGATAITVTVDVRDGAGIRLLIPMTDFQALARR